MPPCLCLEDGEHLSFCNHVVEADENGFEFARGRRSDRDFHLHGFDKGNVVAIADVSADFNRKRANAPRHFGHNLDFWHSALPGNRLTDNCPRERLFVVAADCLR